MLVYAQQNEDLDQAQLYDGNRRIELVQYRVWIVQVVHEIREISVPVPNVRKASKAELFEDQDCRQAQRDSVGPHAEVRNQLLSVPYLEERRQVPQKDAKVDRKVQLKRVKCRVCLICFHFFN